VGNWLYLTNEDLIFGILIVLFLAAGAIGYDAGLSKKRLFAPILILIVLISSVIL
jgi:hypothetical protein